MEIHHLQELNPAVNIISILFPGYCPQLKVFAAKTDHHTFNRSIKTAVVLGG